MCLGSTVFTLVSIHGFDDLLGTSTLNLSVDPTRVAAQVVMGVGFLGAGAIIRQGVSIHGLTTAASLWTMAALGMVVGLGWYALAAIVTVAVAISLTLLRIVERRLIYPRTDDHLSLEVIFAPGYTAAPVDVTRLLEQRHATILEMRADKAPGEGERLQVTLRLPGSVARAQLVEELGKLEPVRSVAVY